MNPVVKVVGIHALINAGLVAGATIIMDVYKLYYKKENIK